MSRLDRHVSTVQNKLMLRTLATALAWCVLGLSLLVFLAILVDRVFGFSLPRPRLFLLSGGGACIVLALGYAILRRPSRHAAAVAIDESLGLKEKFSTALYVRANADPFAAAAVRDAEHAAENVSLYRRFPLQYPRPASGAMAIIAVAFLSAWLPHMDLFGHAEARKRMQATAQDQVRQQQTLAAEDASVEALLKAPVSKDIFKIAQQAKDVLNHPTNDPTRTSRAVLSKMLEEKEALQKAADTEVKFRQAEKDEELLKNMADSSDDSTPMGKVQNEIKNQQFDQAVKDVSKAVSQFNTMDKKQQDAAVQQAATLAAALSKAANNPALQQQIATQLSQLTANPQMAANLAKAMTAAAQGNPQAAQQAVNIAQQIASQMNNGQGPTARQQQMMQQMLTGTQAMANSQAQAQALAQAARQLAQAMQSAQAAGSQKSGQAQVNAQSKVGQPAQGNAGQSSAGQGNNAQANAGQSKTGGQSQSGGQPQSGNGAAGSAGQPQPGGQQNAGAAGPQDSKQMAAAQQNVQQQLQQLQNAQQDAQQMAAQQQAVQQAIQQAAQGAGSNPGDSPGQDAQANADQGNGGNGKGGNNGNTPGQPGQPGNGGGLGMGGGIGGEIRAAPGATYKAFDPAIDQEKGRMLASRFVHAGIDPGKATAEMKAYAQSGQKEDEDDVEVDRIPKGAQKSVREYFSELQKE